MDDPDATWQQARELEREMMDVVRRVGAGEVTRAEGAELWAALLLNAPPEAMAMSTRRLLVQRAARRRGGDPG